MLSNDRTGHSLITVLVRKLVEVPLSPCLDAVEGNEGRENVGHGFFGVLDNLMMKK